MSGPEFYSEDIRTPKPPKSSVTWGLYLATLVIWVATLLLSTLIRDFAFMPAAALFEPWRFLSAAFSHSIPIPLHLGFNRWALWVVGCALEPIVRHAKLFLSFMICVLMTSLACCLAALLNLQAQLVFIVNTSGAVFGFFGIVLAIQWMLRLPYTEMVALIGISFVIGLVLPNVAWAVHLGGPVARLAVGGFAAWRSRHATLVEIPIREVSIPDNLNPPKAVVLHRVITTRDRIYDILLYVGLILLPLGASWLFYRFNYHTVYSLPGFQVLRITKGLAQRMPNRFLGSRPSAEGCSIVSRLCRATSNSMALPAAIIAGNNIPTSAA